MNAPRTPSKALVECDSNDVVKTLKNPRKNRVLLQLPGLMAPLSAGRVGTLKGLATPEPTLTLTTRDGRDVVLKGRYDSSTRDYMTLRATDDTLAVRDVFDRVVVFEPPEGESAPAETPELDAPPDFEFGLSSSARALGGGGGARKRSASRGKGEEAEVDSESSSDDGDFEAAAPSGPRQSSGRARKKVSYAGADEADAAESDRDDKDATADDFIDLAAEAAPKRPSGGAAPPAKKPRASSSKSDDSSDDDVVFAGESAPKRASSGRAKAPVSYGGGGDGSESEEEAEFDDGSDDDDDDD